MWFPTAFKLDVALRALLERMGIVQLDMEDIQRESQQFDAVLGPSQENQQFVAAGEQIMVALMSTLRLLRAGELTVRDVNTKTTIASVMVQRHESIFHAMNAARRAGADAANRHFASKEC